MSQMLTIVIPNRNRDLKVVQRTLRSIAGQLRTNAKVVVVDYGSAVSYQKEVEKQIDAQVGISLISCPTQGQLWNKCRAINIALKACTTPYFFVADMDMIFHPDFVERILSQASPDKVTYFQVGFLSPEETAKEKSFVDYQIAHLSKEEATGMTLFPTHLLKDIHGYDEFYHGWGAEDTDVHVRIENVGHQVYFYEEQPLMLHQHHEKVYRTKESLEPYFSHQAKVNHARLTSAKNTKRTQVNRESPWGSLPLDIHTLSTPINRLEISNKCYEIHALLMSHLPENSAGLDLRITKTDTSKVTETLKRGLGKKVEKTYTMDMINDLLLAEIIKKYRTHPYAYQYNAQTEEITLLIHPKQA
jgi:glycosyltransferase involved in cell wall biosynthesis